MRVFVVLVGLLVASSAHAGDLVTSGKLVRTKKGPVYRGTIRDEGGAVVAAFDLGRKTHGATLHREALDATQDVRLLGGREIVVRAHGRSAAWRPLIQIDWTLDRRKGVATAIGTVTKGDRVWAVERVTISRQRAEVVREDHTPGRKAKISKATIRAKKKR